MSVIRSVEIKRYSCLVPFQTAFETVGELVNSGCVEIQTTDQQDTKNSFYIVLSRIKALRTHLEKLLESIQKDYGMSVKRLTYDQKKVVIAKMRTKLSEWKQQSLKLLDSEQDKIERKLDHINTMVANYSKLQGMLTSNQQECDVVRSKLEMTKGQSSFNQFSLLTGVCTLNQQYLVERFVFRVSRGYSYVLFKPRKNDSQSVVVTAFVSGDKRSVLYNKLQRFFTCNNIVMFDLPNSEDHLSKYLDELEAKNKELKALLGVSQKTLMEAMDYYVQPPELPRIMKKITKISYLQRIAFILCHLQPTGSTTHFLIGFHKPVDQPLNLTIPNLFQTESTQYTPRTCLPTLPCLYEANLLTELFSVPQHKQIIPSVFILSTLPILFGIMFSDMGHGVMLLAVAYGLNLGVMWKLMALMSIYCGALFNEFFGMKVGLVYYVSGGKFGVNPVWGVATNSLAFQNSLKMKLSIMVGFAHITFGLVLRIANQVHLKKFKDAVYDGIPKLIFFFATVGYMTYLIALKWSMDWHGKERLSPSIITMILEMYLGYHSGRTNTLFSSVQKEKQISSYLKIVCVVCLILISFGKSIHEWITRPSQAYSRLQEEQRFEEELDEREDNPQHNPKRIEHQQHEHQTFGPLEAFEYILSTISSITSYLRLFALSLSHQKLSHLLLTFLLSGLKGQHPNVSLLRSLVFFVITVLMMLTLDVMECAMHVIRLHWVEWMGKFYSGGGTKYKPERLQ